MMPVASCLPFPFSVPCDDMLTMFVRATRWLSMRLYTLVHMSMHESCLIVCHPYFNTMKLWTSDQNLHLSFVDTTFYLPSFFLVCLLLHPFAHYLRISFFPLLICWFSCSCLCMYTHKARTHGTRAWSLKRKQKGRRRKHVDISQAAMFSSFRGLASPIWLCTLLNSLPSSLISLLDRLY